MAPIRFCFNTKSRYEIETIIENISENNEHLMKYVNNQYSPGFYKWDKNTPIFKKIYENYYIVNYLEVNTHIISTLKTELSYYDKKLKDTEKKTVTEPLLLKIILNSQEGILCFYSPHKIPNEMVNVILKRLDITHGFSFKYPPKLHTFKKNSLDDFIRILDIKDYTAISVWNKDNLISIKNPGHRLTPTKKVEAVIDELKAGNWSHVKIRDDDLDFEIRINNRTQKFLTFENDYITDLHLVKAADYLASKIIQAEKFSNERQTRLKAFT